MRHDVDAALSARRRRILRIALAVAAGLTVAEALEQPFSFLAPLLAFQLLVKMPAAPTARQGLGFVLVVAVSAGFALALASALHDYQFVYLTVLALVFFGSFLMQAAGKGGPLPSMLLVCNAMVPVLAVISRDLAADFVAIMILSAAAAVLLAWLAHALLPEPAPSRIAPPPPQTVAPISLWAPVACTIVLMPAVIHYLANDDEVSIVVLMTMIAILGQGAGLRGRVALGLVLGNLIGGILASIAYDVVLIVPSLFLLFLVVLAVALLLTEGATRATPEAGVFAVAVPTFLILLGLGLTPVTDGSGAAFVSRLIDVALASFYALAGIVLLVPLGGAATYRKSSI